MKKLYEEENIQFIADSIRSKTGSTDKLKLADMSNEIDGIDLETYQKIIDRTITEVNLPNVTSVGYCGFNCCTSLTEVNLPNVTSVGYAGFSNCTSLTEVNLPNVTSVGEYGFDNCTGLGKGYVLDFPKLETIGNYAFYNCLTYCGHFVVRRTDKLVECVGGIYHFGGYNIVKPAYFYFPKSMIEQYKTADVWKMYYGISEAYQFRALEDYTVDGTITGELDESKI